MAPLSIAEQISIHQLLTHTSGLGSYFNEKFIASSRTLFREIDDYKSVVAGGALAFQPGHGRLYSGTGYLLLGALIDKVSGENYFDYIRQHIYQPVGMINSDSYEMDIPVVNRAIGDKATILL